MALSQLPVADALPTPRLVVREKVVVKNIARLAKHAAAKGLKVRPHCKTHKSRYFARMQIEAGATGLTVAKAGEAEVLAEACEDILVAYPIVSDEPARRLARLAGNIAVRVAVDSDQAIAVLGAAAGERGATIGILIDLDIGYHRTGVQSPQAAVELAMRADQTAGVRLDGLFCYPGHVVAPAALQNVAQLLGQTLDLWRRHGLAAKIVSGGSTPTAYQPQLAELLTEIRPGTYIFNDMNTVRGGYCDLADCAASLVCTVVSSAVPGKVILDAGSKTLTSDRAAAGADAGFGHIVEFPEAKIVRLTEEHGEADISACPAPPRLGQVVHVIPNHICPCVNLQDAIYLEKEDGQVMKLPVDARGKST